MYKIVAIATYCVGKQTDHAIEDWGSVERAMDRMSDWAAFHGATENLSIDGLFFFYRFGTFRVEEVR